MDWVMGAAVLLAGSAHAGTSAMSAPTEKLAETRLVVMTFNARYAGARDGQNAWSNRQALFLKTIEQNQPDLLGCQEILKTQAEFLQQNLTNYAFLGTGRDDGRTRGEYSPILCRKSRFEVMDSGQFWLSPTPERVGVKGWDAASARICTWAKLRLRESNTTIYYFNSHWDNLGRTARAESGKLIRRVAAEKAQGDAVIITGDFNSFEDDAGYLNLIAPTNRDGLTLVDAYREVHPKTSLEELTFHDFKGTQQGRRIDYIFHTPHFEAVRAEIDHTHAGSIYPSDHYPVVTELIMKSPMPNH
jgi:endonuclease/exonuclease/phosphatase family metal-dependent hydrolase